MSFWNRKKVFCWLIIIFCLVGGYYLWKGEWGRVTAPWWVIEVKPGPSGRAELYPAVKVTVNDKVEDYTIKLFRRREGVTPVSLAPVPGFQEVSEGQLVFRPEQVLIPDSDYLVMIVSKKDKSRVFRYEFKTKDMQDRLWMAVKLGRVHTAVIYKGQEPIKWMPASGGRPGCETPLGIFYAGDRGNRFWSARYGEGALYWIRLKGNYLIHSVPRGEGWQIKMEEHNKLGLPASHGCVRLSDIDAKWVYDNLPQGAMVVIHP
ncbi:MAG: L,D-transpeptidase family protein [Clostridia bacterium]|nr:L,D-transpeptidase family protein [Clostridia bacterium]